jgi:hypothetical protein
LEKLFSAIKSFLLLPQNDKSLSKVILRRPTGRRRIFFKIQPFSNLQ